MNVLSLFDGMSCGRVALERLGVKVDKYFASEVDKYAIAVSKDNWPDVVHIGDVTKVSYKDGWLSTEHGEYEIGEVDLLLAGSPCQGFSLAGEQLGFDDPRSKLYFEFERIKNECSPKFWMLENVKMKQEYKDVITKRLGAVPVEINSKWFSAQNRQRLYWCNLEVLQDMPGYAQKLKDVLEHFGTESYIHSDKALTYMNRVVSGGRNHWDFAHHSDVKNDKSAAVVSNFYKGVPYNVLIDGNVIRKFTPKECERLQTLPDDYTKAVSATQRYKMLGNGWTVDVIAHVLKGLKNEY